MLKLLKTMRMYWITLAKEANKIEILASFVVSYARNVSCYLLPCFKNLSNVLKGVVLK